MSRYLMILLAALFSVGLAGCNTMQGAGEDIEAAGEVIEETAEETEEEID